jgi:hypothetical protein
MPHSLSFQNAARFDSEQTMECLALSHIKRNGPGLEGVGASTKRNTEAHAMAGVCDGFATKQPLFGERPRKAIGVRSKSKVLMVGPVCLQFMGDLLASNDSDLMRGSRHSIHRESRGRRLFLDAARSDNRHLQRTDWETGNFVLWQLLFGGRNWGSKREDRYRCNEDSLEYGHSYLLVGFGMPDLWRISSP